MISKNNFKRVVPQLREQNKGSLDYKQSSWDTFRGWKKRGMSVMKDEKGSSVKILMPVFRNGQIVHKTDKNGALVPVIRPRNHFLFHISQTMEVA